MWGFQGRNEAPLADRQITKQKMETYSKNLGVHPSWPDIAAPNYCCCWPSLSTLSRTSFFFCLLWMTFSSSESGALALQTSFLNKSGYLKQNSLMGKMYRLDGSPAASVNHFFVRKSLRHLAQHGTNFVSNPAFEELRWVRREGGWMGRRSNKSECHGPCQDMDH